MKQEKEVIQVQMQIMEATIEHLNMTLINEREENNLKIKLEEASSECLKRQISELELRVKKGSGPWTGHDSCCEDDITVEIHGSCTVHKEVSKQYFQYYFSEVNRISDEMEKEQLKKSSDSEVKLEEVVNNIDSGEDMITDEMEKEQLKSVSEINLEEVMNNTVDQDELAQAMQDLLGEAEEEVKLQPPLRWKCGYCDKDFKTKVGRSVHIERVHHIKKE